MANLFSPEKVYATTGTFYPDADPETSTVDGTAYGQTTVNADFATVRGQAGTHAYDDGSVSLRYLIGADEIQDSINNIWRAFILFNTSSLGGGAVISSAVFSGYGSENYSDLGEAYHHLAGSTPASNTAIVPSDYQQIGRVSFGSISYASFATSGYNNITLNANGLANISKTGISKFSMQNSWDINNNFTGTWVQYGNGGGSMLNSETAGTSQDPKLTVTYTLPSNPKQDVIWFD